MNESRLVHVLQAGDDLQQQRERLLRVDVARAGRRRRVARRQVVAQRRVLAPARTAAHNLLHGVTKADWAVTQLSIRMDNIDVLCKIIVFR